MERWPSGSGAPASEVTTVSTAANVPSTFHAKNNSINNKIITLNLGEVNQVGKGATLAA